MSGSGYRTPGGACPSSRSPRSHGLIAGVKVPTVCLILGRDEVGSEAYFGVISSLGAVTTLETRIKVRRALRIETSSEAELLDLAVKKPHSTNLRDRLGSDASVVRLSPKLSEHLVEKLAEIDGNRGALHAVAASLNAPKYFRGAEAVQEDAIHATLKTFGLSADHQAVSLETVGGKETALARINVVEDGVIEHDARRVPGYDLVGSDMTGRAVFERGTDRLEVYTANRRPLEKVLGVDLIYINITRQNVVMLQYKMLEPHDSDWIYRPDKKLKEEIARMRRFATAHPPGPNEYRLNPQVFYLKFVKRDGAIRSGGIVMPIDHFDTVRDDPACKGPRGAFRVSYDTLGGRYLREGAFLDLVRSGYIGAHATTTATLKSFVEGTVRNDRAVVAAVQSVQSLLEERT